MNRTVGLFLMSDDSAYQVANRVAAQSRARELGLDLQVFFAGSVGAQQSQDVIRFIYAHPGRELCVVIMPTTDIDSAQGVAEDHPLQKLARRVVSHGAGWIILNRDAGAMVAALQREAPRVPVGLVTPEQREIGRIQGRQLRHLLPRGGRVLYVLGNPFVSSTRDRRAGLQEVLSGAREFVVDEVDGYWSAETAKNAVARWLLAASARGEWPALVGCQNDEMAGGTARALAEAARTFREPALASVPVTGVDGLPDQGKAWVQEGKLAATIIQPTTADVAIGLLARAWASGSPLPARTAVPVTPFPENSVGPAA